MKVSVDGGSFSVNGGCRALGAGSSHSRRQHLRCRFCAWVAWFAWSCAQSLAILLWFFLFLVLLLLFCLDVVGCAALARFDRLALCIELGLETMESLDRLLRGLDLLLDLLLRVLCPRSFFKLTQVVLMAAQITSKKEAEPTTVLRLLQPLVALCVRTMPL